MAVKSAGLYPSPLQRCFSKHGEHTTNVPGDNFRLCIVMADLSCVVIVMCIRKNIAGTPNLQLHSSYCLK